MNALLRWLAWCIALAIAYEILEDSPAGQELVAGPVAAALCAAIMLRLFGVARTHYSINLGDLVAFKAVPLAVMRDVITLTGAILRSFQNPEALKGSVVHEPLSYGKEFEPHDAGRRAIETLRISVAPASIVCLIRPGEIQIHRIGSTR